MAAPIIRCGACVEEGRQCDENCPWSPMFPPGRADKYRFLINYFGRPRLKREFNQTPVEQRPRPVHFEDLFQDALLEFAHRNNGGVARRFRAMEQTIVQQQAYIQFLLGLNFYGSWENFFRTSLILDLQHCKAGTVTSESSTKPQPSSSYWVAPSASRPWTAESATRHWTSGWGFSTSEFSTKPQPSSSYWAVESVSRPWTVDQHIGIGQQDGVFQQVNPQLNLNPPHHIRLQNQQTGLGQQVGIFPKVNTQLNLNPPHHIGQQDGINEHGWPPNDQFGIALQHQQPDIGQQLQKQNGINERGWPPNDQFGIALQDQQPGIGHQDGVFQQVNPHLNLNPLHHIGLQHQQAGLGQQEQQPDIGQHDGVFQQVNPQVNLNLPHHIGLQNQHQAGLGQQVDIFQQVNPQLNLNPPPHIWLQQQDGFNEHEWPPDNQFGIALQDKQPASATRYWTTRWCLSTSESPTEPQPSSSYWVAESASRLWTTGSTTRNWIAGWCFSTSGSSTKNQPSSICWVAKSASRIWIAGSATRHMTAEWCFSTIESSTKPQPSSSYWVSNHALDSRMVFSNKWILKPPHHIGLQNQQAGLGLQVRIFQQVNPQLNLNPPNHIGLQKQDGINEHRWPLNDQFGISLQDQQLGIGRQDGFFRQVYPKLSLNLPHHVGLQNQQAGLGQQVGIFQQVNPQLNLNPPHHIGLQQQDGINEHRWPPNDQFGIAPQDQQPSIGQQDGVFNQVNPQLNLNHPYHIGLQNQ
ncbi:hypothetical protein CQW23_05607 [Capsicum baccatum]|uniref:LOB domain-containing protein n=1 Tax=Capsicum baccatum TaxID=33114 RepID=A0A2G2XIF1_CAPBA|nr:hypothetical protein CQW23_05607 [Capsicum baccatum]